METFVEAHYLTIDNDIDSPSVLLMLPACPHRGDHIVLADKDKDKLQAQLLSRLKRMTEAGQEYNPYVDTYGAYYIGPEEGFRAPGEVVNRVCFVPEGNQYRIHIFLGKLLFDNEDGTQMDFADFDFEYTSAECDNVPDPSDLEDCAPDPMDLVDYKP